MTDRTRRLILLRHAKAERSGGVVDELRPLALRGRMQASGVASSLRADELVPDEVLCSAAIRTRQTCELVLGGFGDAAPESVEYLDALYGAGVLDVLALVRAVDDRIRTLLVVGHEPAMSATAARLAVRRPLVTAPVPGRQRPSVADGAAIYTQRSAKRP